MRPLAATLALACLAGCAGPMPREVIEQGARTEQASTLTSRQAANCLARNGQNVTDLYWATLNDLPAKDTFEVIFNAPSVPMAGALMVIHTRPAASGSTITFHASPRMFESAKPMWIERLGKGC